MEYILLVLAATTSALKGLICKKIGSNNDDSKKIYLLNSGIFLAASVTVLAYTLISGKKLSLSPFSIVLASIFALVLVFTQITETYAMKRGPASLTILIYSLGLVFPILYGKIFLNEKISLIQIFGMALVIFALFFIINPKKDKKLSAVWLIFSLLACVGSGTTAVIQKLHQSSDVKNELTSFLILAFVFASIFSLLVSFFTNSNESKAGLCLKDFKFILFSGLCIGTLNILNLFLAGKLPAIIQFPIYNIGGMILTGIGGRVFFNERMSREKLIGFSVGCIAILMIGLG